MFPPFWAIGSYISVSGSATLHRATFQIPCYNDFESVCVSSLLCDDLLIINFNQTRRLEDPLTAQFADYKSEQMVVQGRTLKGLDSAHFWESETMGREDTDPVMWLAMQLVQINSTARERSRLFIT